MTDLSILMVEDDAILCDLLTLRLTKIGYSIQGMFASGEDALKSISGDPPDIILMDISLSGKMDGIETARQVRERFDIPVVYLTASTDSETFERALKSGDCEYVIKPFTDNDLLIAIELAHHKHKLDKENKNKQKNLEDIVNNTGDAIIRTDENGHVTFINPAALALIWDNPGAGKVSLDEFVKMADEKGHRIGDLVPESKTTMAVLDIPDGTSIRTIKGDMVRVRGSISPVRDDYGRFRGVILTIAAPGRNRALHSR